MLSIRPTQPSARSTHTKDVDMIMARRCDERQQIIAGLDYKLERNRVYVRAQLLATVMRRGCDLTLRTLNIIEP